MNTPAPRPLTPDAITDQFVDYVHEDYFWSTSDRVRLEKPALKHALLDAVKRIAEPPARPEGAEDIEAVLYDALPSARLDEDEISNLANALANHRSGESA